MQEYYNDIKSIIKELAPYGINVILKGNSTPNDFIVVIPFDSKVKKKNAYIRNERAMKLARETVEKTLAPKFREFSIEYLVDKSRTWDSDMKSAVLKSIK